MVIMSKERTGTTVAPAALRGTGDTTVFTPGEHLEEEVKYSCVVGEVMAKTLFMHYNKHFKIIVFTKKMATNY